VTSAQTGSVIRDPWFRGLKELVIEFSGLAYYETRDDALAKVVADRLETTGVRDCASYLDALQRDADGTAEFEELIAALTVGETHFFRHRELFHAMRSAVVPDVLERNRDRRRIRIWSAGCATGEEVYSVAILLDREFGSALNGWDVSIIGTDVNHRFLSRARDGAFGEWAFRGAPEYLKREYFVPEGNRWALRNRFEDWVTFRVHNLVSEPFPSSSSGLGAFDIVLCRNVIIYFDDAVIARLAESLRESLVDGGWLLVGSADADFERFRRFRHVSVPGAILYQRPVPALGEELVHTACSRNRTESAPASNDVPEAATAPPPSEDACDERSTPRPDRGDELPTNGDRSIETSGANAISTIREWVDRGDWAEAQQVCEQELARDRLQPLVHYYLGCVLEQQEEWHAAQAALRQAIYLDRNLILAHYHLGVLLQRCGDGDAAIRSFENAARLLTCGPDELAGGDGVTADELDGLVRTQLQRLREAMKEAVS